jgi:hypothetical protein
MNLRTSRSVLVRVGAIASFLLAVLLLGAACWLFAERDFPALPLGKGTYMDFRGLSVNGLHLPGWTFYLIPGSLCLASVALFFLGWRMGKLTYEERP